MADPAETQTNGRKVLVATSKNEGPYLLEWLAYYRSIGFGEFCLFTNDCIDATNLILDRLDQMGVVRHFKNVSALIRDPQRSAYSQANQMAFVKSADWVLVADADEFLNIHCGDGSVDALIAACGAPDAISVNWRIMGSCGHVAMEDGLITERFDRGSDFEKPENGLVWGFKTLFRPQKFDYFGVHRPRFFPDRAVSADDVVWTNGDGRVLGDKFFRKGWRSNRHNIGYSLAQMNHYAVKSREEFILKQLRGTANSKDRSRINTEYFVKHDLNAHHDASIETGGIRPIVDEWMTDAALAELVAYSREVARATIENQKNDPEVRAFLEHGPAVEEAQ